MLLASVRQQSSRVGLGFARRFLGAQEALSAASVGSLQSLSSLATAQQSVVAAKPTAGAFAPAVAMTRGFATVVDGLKYAESHEWLKMDGDTATVGITDFAQSELGDVVYVELPEVGSTVSKAETFGVVESVKAASDVYAPVSGEVLEINDALVDDPSKLNTEPFEGGWMMKIKVSDAGEADGLLDADAYKANCDE
mmetsp:Transcript_2079/g.5284  ORF Transcript_2079/g.5284 Transcript_2079/m.5284 type:complete len:196 (-) Transcript_2079:118-705(-)|eukprot:CAMPEP_0197494458 /NCGR_PEP_ID=MMETSP1311-20131121/30148_1 /TAXON_ID=464262 /ORGANISM="Genus nov. species nov., Strain RCC856" /LENGTH=195 /DNA_ID=CAMNT_0043039853 /DNA_START=150 /DNA_END=737 /DNA_ORIENTATION=+